MKNYKMIVSYDGTRYFGWEHQPGKDLTIQGKLESVLEAMETGEHPDAQPRRITVIGAGRTDAGVHARAMTCNVLLETDKTEEEIQAYMNRYLPDDISVNEVRICADRFHSRFKAIGKTYRYTLWCGPAKPVFDRKYVTVLSERPDTEKMREAAELLTGMHDYKSFCGNPKMKKQTIRVVDTIRIEESGNYIRLYFHGNGFLQNMVRIMTGTLLEVGFGKREPSEMTGILEALDRRLAGPTAPAQGLTLMKVDY
ncbi:MAG: tRNA pseudouridine(38-40) synthase TruA [Lachnospiraceae bacterium]|nr:tRNA pseudouridine(38-40) synthase TruA [Lachnospiraceae bacterium]